MINKIKYISLVLFLSSINLLNVHSQQLKEIQFEVIKEGESAIDEKKQMTIENESDFKDLLMDIYSNINDGSGKPYIPIIEKINFEKYIVAGIFFGKNNNSSVNSYTNKIIEKENKIIIRIIESYAGYNCNTLPMESHPFQLIKFSRTNKDIEFRIKKVVKNCN